MVARYARAVAAPIRSRRGEDRPWSGGFLAAISIRVRRRAPTLCGDGVMLRRRLYNLLRSTLSQRRRNRLKRHVTQLRSRLAPLYRARYGAFDAQELCDEIARRLPQDVEIIMVHCSLNDLQPMYRAGPRELLDALVRLCGADRTLVMPTFFFGGPDQDAGLYYRETRVFDAGRHPSQMGLLSELFRRRTGVRRSVHPTASVSALGPLADELVRGHHLAATTFGKGTPFDVMAQRRTAIVGIGTEYFRSLSQVHAAEDLLEERYPLPLRASSLPVQLRDVDGTVHDYELRVNAEPMGRRLERLERLLAPGELVQWRFHGVPLYVTSAARVTEALTEAALRGETIYDAMPIGARRAPR